jgi:hypothetical protein
VFVAVFIQHAISIRHVVICGLPYSKIFFPLSHKRHDFLKKVIEYKICVLTSSTTFLILRTRRNMIKKMSSGRRVSTCYSCSILINFNFLDSISKNTQIAGTSVNRIELFHADRSVIHDYSKHGCHRYITEFSKLCRQLLRLKASFTIVNSLIATRKDWARKS